MVKKLLTNTYVLGFLGLVLLVLGIWFYGNLRDSEGYARRDTEALKETTYLQEQAREQEVSAHIKSEKARDEAFKQKQVSDAAIDSLTADVAGLRSTIAYQATRLKTTRLAPGDDAIASACWFALDESVQRYKEVAGDADSYVERLRIGQGWAGAIGSSGKDP